MYPSVIITGWKATPKGPRAENIYTGNDGVAASAAAEKARKSEAFLRIGKLFNCTTMVPLGTRLHAAEKIDRKPQMPSKPPAPPLPSDPGEEGKGE